MPHYDYRCSKCGKFTIYQGIKEKALDICPTCGSPVHRLIGKNVNIVYKCSGFYCTDTRSPSGNAKAESSDTVTNNANDTVIEKNTINESAAETKAVNQ